MAQRKIPVILDTDIGTDIDDTWALIQLLNTPELDPRLILTAIGDTRYRAKLTAKLLETAGRTDIPIGVGIYQDGGHLNFQEPWLDGFELSNYKGTIFDDGLQAMIRIIMDSDEPITLISIAAVTNIARALEIEPGIAGKCRFVGMHGSLRFGYAGQPGAIPEANVRGNIPGLRKVFSAPWLEKIITPLDTCGVVVLSDERYQRVFKPELPIIKALMENNKMFSENVTWMKVDYAHERSTTLFDMVAVYLALSQRELINFENMRISVTDDRMTVLDPNGYELQVAISWKDLDSFLDYLVERLLT